MLEQLYLNKREILKKSQELFLNSSNHIPKIGCELEFFLLNEDSSVVLDQDLLSDLIFELRSELVTKFSLIYDLEKEQGASQMEVKTEFAADLELVCSEIENVRIFISDFAKQRNLIASFAAQPFCDDCGSALQFNISLHDESDKNVFEFDSKIIEAVASALLQKTNEMMILLAPKEDDYLRFCPETNLSLFKAGKYMAPINLSFGADNRTCAIRIPQSKNNRRLEYRVAAAGSDPFLVTSALLVGLQQFQNTESNLVQIYGNAFDKQYHLQNLCQSLFEAQAAFMNEGNFFRNFYQDSLQKSL